MKKWKGTLAVVLMYGGTLNAQVKIGDNPNTINPNSMLELESTNKGFLPPRLPLNDANDPAPLAATLAVGTMVYSTGGVLPDGYYFWNGTGWVGLSQTSQERDDHVLVKSAADLPAPVAGVITLVSGVEYEINGIITLSSSINLNGCSLRGADSGNDRIVYSGTGALFTGDKVGSIRFLTMSAPSGSIFNIDAGGALVNMLVQNCFFVGSTSVGTIAGVGGTVFFGTVAYFTNTNGITLENDNYVVLNHTLWDASNAGTYERFNGTFSVIQVLGGDRLVGTGNTGLDISGITSILAGTVNVVLFTGAGTYVNGSFTNPWEVEAWGLRTEKDEVAGGTIHITATATTTASLFAVNVPIKVAGTTTPSNLFRATAPVDNRIVYTGKETRSFLATCSLTASLAPNNTTFSFYIAKNGVVLPESRQQIKMNTTSDQNAVPISCRVVLAPNDFVEVFVENNTSSSDIVVTTMNLTIQ